MSKWGHRDEVVTITTRIPNENTYIVEAITDELNSEFIKQGGYWMKSEDGTKRWHMTKSYPKHLVASLLNKKHKRSLARMYRVYELCMRTKQRGGSFTNTFWDIIYGNYYR